MATFSEKEAKGGPGVFKGVHQIPWVFRGVQGAVQGAVQGCSQPASGRNRPTKRARKARTPWSIRILCPFFGGQLDIVFPLPGAFILVHVLGSSQRCIFICLAARGQCQDVHLYCPFHGVQYQWKGNIDLTSWLLT